jgi:hypothetical protein
MGKPGDYWQRNIFCLFFQKFGKITIPGVIVIGAENHHNFTKPMKSCALVRKVVIL